MVIKVRSNRAFQLQRGTQYQVRGGKLALTMTATIGLMIITSQIFISLGVLPALG